VPVEVAAVLVEKLGKDMIMAIGEDSGGDCDLVPEKTASWSMAAINLWLDVFDDYALSSFIWFHLLPILGVHGTLRNRGLSVDKGHTFYRQLAVIFIGSQQHLIEAGGDIPSECAPFSPYDRFIGIAAVTGNVAF